MTDDDADSKQQNPTASVHSPDKTEHQTAETDQFPDTGPTPRLRAVPKPEPVQPPKRNWRYEGIKNVTATAYEAMWVAYRDGNRRALQLSRACLVSRGTATKAINEGWPDQGFAPLLERAKLADRQRAEEEAKRASEAFREQVDEFYRVRRRNLQYLAGVSALGARALRKIQGALDGATFVRYRRVTRLVDGQPQTLSEAYVPATEVLSAMQSTAAYLARIATVEKQWLEAGSSSPEAQQGAEQPPTTPLTPEQWDYILQHNGALPPGVDEQTVIASLAAMSTPEPAKAG